MSLIIHNFLSLETENLGKNECPRDCPKKRRVTFRDTQGFTFTAVPGGAANNALFGSTTSMKSRVPVKLNILRKFVIDMQHRTLFI